MANFTEERISEYKEAFCLFDREGSGTIPSSQVGTVVRALGRSPTEAQVSEMVQAVDPSKTGLINFEAFLKIMDQASQIKDSEQDLLAAFKVFDRESQGYITAQELRHIITHLGEKLREEEADELVREADVEGTGKIYYEHLVKMMMAK